MLCLLAGWVLMGFGFWCDVAIKRLDMQKKRTESRGSSVICWKITKESQLIHMVCQNYLGLPYFFPEFYTFRPKRP
jgi:hypothetical protein